MVGCLLGLSRCKPKWRWLMKLSAEFGKEGREIIMRRTRPQTKPRRTMEDAVREAQLAYGVDPEKYPPDPDKPLPDEFVMFG